MYDTKHYLEATGICNLRRDKPLRVHKPNIVVSSIDSIIWTAFNSDGLILAVLTSSESRGTFANLLNVVDLVKVTVCNAFTLTFHHFNCLNLSSTRQASLYF